MSFVVQTKHIDQLVHPNFGEFQANSAQLPLENLEQSEAQGAGRYAFGDEQAFTPSQRQQSIKEERLSQGRQRVKHCRDSTEDSLHQ
jgi:hypothetical protein